jgi:hypothetical protein
MDLSSLPNGGQVAAADLITSGIIAQDLKAPRPNVIADASVTFSFPTTYRATALQPGAVYDAFVTFNKGTGNRWTFGSCNIGLFQVKPDNSMQFVLNIAEQWTTFVEAPEVTTLEWQVPQSGVLPAVPGLYKLQANCGVFDYTAAQGNGDAGTDDEQIISQSDAFGIDSGNGLYAQIPLY